VDTRFASPLVPGTHFLPVASVADARAAATMPHERWAAMSDAGRAWYRAHGSPDGVLRTLVACAKQRLTAT
jgi:hypothetical protein